MFPGGRQEALKQGGICVGRGGLLSSPQAQGQSSSPEEREQSQKSHEGSTQAWGLLSSGALEAWGLG